MESAIKKKRPERISKACENCRKRKIKCSGSPSCRECSKYSETCIFRQHYREPKKNATVQGTKTRYVKFQVDDLET